MPDDQRIAPTPEPDVAATAAEAPPAATKPAACAPAVPVPPLVQDGRLLNALSVDVEDYYQVAAFDDVVSRDDWARFPERVTRNTAKVLEMFAKADVQGTFFILGCVADKHPGLVRDIAAAGHEVASHGWGHERVGALTPEVFRADVARTRMLLEDIAGQPVRGYRAPSFSIDRTCWWAFQELAAAGYRYSSSVNPIRHDHYGVEDAPRFPFQPVAGLAEIPMTTVEWRDRRLPCSGGGYFRLMPYRLFRRGLARMHAADAKPGIFYFHPWEIDPDQPRIPGAPLKSRFRHYVKLSAMAGKIDRLLRDFRWGRMDHVFLTPEGDLR